MIHVMRISDIYQIFASLYFFNYFHFCFHCYRLALLSSTSYITTAFTLASGLEIKLLYYCTLYSTVKYTEAQPLVEDACMWQCMPDTWTNTWLDMWTHVCIFESLHLEGSYVGGLLYKKRRRHTEEKAMRRRNHTLEFCSPKPRNARNHQELEEAKNGFSPEPLKRHFPADTLISDFWPLKL